MKAFKMVTMKCAGLQCDAQVGAKRDIPWSQAMVAGEDSVVHSLDSIGSVHCFRLIFVVSRFGYHA